MKLVSWRNLATVVLAAAAYPLVAAVVPPPAGGKLGPNAPALVDTQGNGPSVGDIPIVPLREGNEIQLPNPWDDCAGENNHNNTFSLGAQQSGRFTTLQGSRVTGGSAGGGVTQSSGDKAMGFSLNFKTGPSSPMLTGVGQLMDQNGDGVFESFHVEDTTPVTRAGNRASAALSMDLTYVFADANNSGHSNYISIPFAQASALGLRRFPDGCKISQPSDPMIWIPLADTNDDGIPDSIVLDLDGNGSADPDLFRSPPLTGPAVVVPCTYTIDPTSKSVPAAGGSFSFAVNTQAGCAWTAVSNNSFITGVTPSGTGPGTVNYSVSSTLGGARTGTITAAGQTHTVNQSAFVQPPVAIPTLSEWGLLALVAALGVAGWLRLRQGGLGL